MQKKFYFFTLLMFSFTLVFSSCGDDEEDNNPKTKTEFLTTGTWNLQSAVTLFDTETLVFDVEGAFITFNANNTYTYTSTAEIDNQFGFFTDGGTWKINSAENKLEFDSNILLDVTVLTETDFALTGTDEGVTTIVFKKR